MNSHINSQQLDFSEFLLEQKLSIGGLDTSLHHPIDICVDRVVRHAPFIICSHESTTVSNNRQYERIFPDKSPCLPIDPRPDHTNLASDSYVGAKCKQNKK
jgi:hypothetical protein